MAEPTLSQVFGSNSSQSNTQVFLDKEDLGLSAESSAEQIFAAIIVRASIYFNESEQVNNSDIQIIIEQGFTSLVSRNDLTYREKQRIIKFQKQDDESDEIIPEDY
ncbi:MAG TPA: hypothetical protein DEG17_19770 [Cyanobacteria bacterium UBA11149]|nr:hypothetical protein [Cyanobacteria bacterium UBA11366]HBK62283.1 hypothetical protein [Cyanobacteria bacterium UBA11166]HBR74239.1 hypothetical protein [Cyanobacteria bacterium UBA11159]HBS69864.1 hypothetical protein [Cyanobacteria bacterium UBA11153]HBW91038.1 hypothetical protein [Cyanobacteria bacterium UBA11149]HCA95029.1 hypothetical protein [Cyanobacteria bacterium UBA9226]